MTGRIRGQNDRIAKNARIPTKTFETRRNGGIGGIFEMLISEFPPLTPFLCVSRFADRTRTLQCRVLTKESAIMRRSVMLFMVLLAAVSGFAQQGAAEAAKQPKSGAQKKPGIAKALPADAPTREEVLKLFDLLQIQKTMQFAIQAAKQQSREKAADATPEQKQQIRQMVNEEMAQALGPAAMQEMMEATVPVYQRHLSRADL